MQRLASSDELRGARVGIVLVSYNAPEYVRVTLDSLCQAKCDAPFAVALVDNASRPENERRISAAFLQAQGLGLEGCYLPQAENLGFSGGNNVGISHFLGESDITHICLLNSDVLVTDHWLDRLLACGADAVGPVSNAVGNEQTVPVDYPAKEADFAAANAFAARWHAMWQGHRVATTFLGFFAVLFSRRLVEQVGLLDTRFFPGSFEDDDYCERIRQHGLAMLIARDVFIHHFGSASFAQLAWKDRYAAADVNRRRFEEKYGRPWEDRSLKALLGMRQDMLFALQQGGSADRRSMARLYFDSLGEQFQALIDYNQHLQGQLTMLQFGGAGHGDAGAAFFRANLDAMGIKGLLAVLAGKCRQKLRKATPGRLAREMRDAFRTRRDGQGGPLGRLAGLLGKAGRGLQLCGTLAGLLFSRKGLLIFSLGYPTPEQERDGYFQRVKAIDARLSDFQRVYVRYHHQMRSAVRFADVGPGIRELHVCERKPAHRALVFLAGLCCGRAYYHSVLRLHEASSRTVMRLPTVRAILDLHGVVPEEFRYHDDYLSGQIYDDLESFAVRRARLVITVTEAMRRHLEGKHGKALRSALLVMPIFLPAGCGQGLSTRQAGGTPVVVYAGGLQKWQQIPKMLDAMTKTQANVRFLICVPHPDALRDMAPAAIRQNPDVTIRSATREELSHLYCGCDYGFLLREDVVVNRVSCPTKLVEYMQHGIVPIIESSDIGDFGSLGMQYVAVRDLVAGKLPSSGERSRMAAANWEIIQALGGAAEQAGNRLIKALGG